MNIYGYKKKIINNDNLLELKEVSFKATPDELEKIAQFMLKTADTMRYYGEKFGHEHFSDFMDNLGGYDGPDIIVGRFG